VTAAWSCDGLEGNDVALPWKDGVTLHLAPFQIVTLKLACG
jgi:hypothetical protein